MVSARLVTHRFLKRLGFHVQRARDPFEDAALLIGATSVKNVVDGGAYDGGLALSITNVFPQAVVHAFEPNVKTFETLVRRTEHEPRVKAYRLALSDQEGQASFHRMEQAYNSSLLSPISATQNEGLTLDQRLISREIAELDTVTTVTLDNWATNAKCSPDLLKLDLQGHENAALRGAKRILSEDVRAVITEVNFRPTYERCTRFHEVQSILESFGFQFFRFYDVITGPSGDWQLGDALFFKPAASGDPQ